MTPLGHLQVNPLTLSMQMPSCLQGALAHSSILISQFSPEIDMMNAGRQIINISTSMDTLEALE